MQRTSPCDCKYLYTRTMLGPIMRMEPVMTVTAVVMAALLRDWFQAVPVSVFVQYCCCFGGIGIVVIVELHSDFIPHSLHNNVFARHRRRHPRLVRTWQQLYFCASLFAGSINNTCMHTSAHTCIHDMRVYFKIRKYLCAYQTDLPLATCLVHACIHLCMHASMPA